MSMLVSAVLMSAGLLAAQGVEPAPAPEVATLKRLATAATLSTAGDAPTLPARRVRLAALVLYVERIDQSASRGRMKSADPRSLLRSPARDRPDPMRERSGPSCPPRRLTM